MRAIRTIAVLAAGAFVLAACGGGPASVMEAEPMAPSEIQCTTSEENTATIQAKLKPGLVLMVHTVEPKEKAFWLARKLQVPDDLLKWMDHMVIYSAEGEPKVIVSLFNEQGCELGWQAVPGRQMAYYGMLYHNQFPTT